MYKKNEEITIKPFHGNIPLTKQYQIRMFIQQNKESFICIIVIFIID